MLGYKLDAQLFTKKNAICNSCSIHKYDELGKKLYLLFESFD